MTIDLNEVSEYIILSDGQKIFSPSNCPSCKFIKESIPIMLISKCSTCEHLYVPSSNTCVDEEYSCLCEDLIKNGYIEKSEDFQDFFRKQLIESFPQTEIIGVSCRTCKSIIACEKGGTNTCAIMNTSGCCIDFEL